MNSDSYTPADESLKSKAMETHTVTTVKSSKLPPSIYSQRSFNKALKKFWVIGKEACLTTPKSIEKK